MCSSVTQAGVESFHCFSAGNPRSKLSAAKYMQYCSSAARISRKSRGQGHVEKKGYHSFPGGGGLIQ